MSTPTDADVRKAGEVRMAWPAQGGPRLPRVLTIQQESELDMAIAQALADQREQGVRIVDALCAQHAALVKAIEDDLVLTEQGHLDLVRVARERLKALASLAAGK